MNFPDWLPEEIAEEAYNILSTPDEDEDKEIATKLTTDTRMRQVWETLSHQKKQPSGKLNLLWQILSSLGYWDDMAYMNLLLTPKQREERVSEIFNAINNLETILDKNYMLLTNYHPEEHNPVNDELDRIKRHLQEYTLFSSTLPTGIGKKTAKRTFLIKELKNFMASEYGKPLHELVATVICVIFDDEDITADHVRKA